MAACKRCCRARPPANKKDRRRALARKGAGSKSIRIVGSRGKHDAVKREPRGKLMLRNRFARLVSRSARQTGHIANTRTRKLRFHLRGNGARAANNNGTAKAPSANCVEQICIEARLRVTQNNRSARLESIRANGKRIGKVGTRGNDYRVRAMRCFLKQLEGRIVPSAARDARHRASAANHLPHLRHNGVRHRARSTDHVNLRGCKRTQP